MRGCAPAHFTLACNLSVGAGDQARFLEVLACDPRKTSRSWAFFFWGQRLMGRPGGRGRADADARCRRDNVVRALEWSLCECAYSCTTVGRWSTAVCGGMDNHMVFKALMSAAPRCHGEEPLVRLGLPQRLRAPRRAIAAKRA